MLAQSPAVGRPTDILHAQQGCVDRVPTPQPPRSVEQAVGSELSGWTNLSLTHPCSPHEPRYRSSMVSLLPNGVINQSFYRDGSHKTPCFTVEG